VVPVATEVERCMCGIAISQNNETGKTNVFLYYTEPKDRMEEPRLLIDCTSMSLYLMVEEEIAIAPIPHLFHLDLAILN